MTDYQYVHSKGCTRNSIWLVACTLFIIILTVGHCNKVNAQPIKTGPVRYLFEGYHPTIGCPECPKLNKPIKSTYHSSAKAIQSVTLLQPIIKEALTSRDSIVYREITTNTQTTDSLWQAVYDLQNGIDHAYMDFDLAITYKNYHNKGWLKIISGLGLQAVGVNLFMHANKEEYIFAEVKETHMVEYTYPIYELVPIYQTPVISKCGPYQPPPIIEPESPDNTNTNDNTNNNTNDNSNSNTNTNTITVITNINVTVPNYILKSYDKTGYIPLVVNNTIVNRVTNKRIGYYMSGTALCLIGVGLEAWGILDLHHAHIIVTRNSVGFRKMF